MSTRLHIVVSEELLARVDGARGLVSRSAWLRAAIERELDRELPMREQERWKAAEHDVAERYGLHPPRAVEQALSESGSRGGPPDVVAPPTPAERPEIKGVIRDPVVTQSQLQREIERQNEQARSYRQSVPGPNVEGVRSSAQAKRDVVPVPKGKS